MDMHYVFGMAEDFGGKPWSYVHYLAITSAVVVNNPARVWFWYQYEPKGDWWEKSKPYLTLRRIRAPKVIHGRPLLHPAHRADVVRLQVLQQYGGTYCDCDVWCLRPFAELQFNGFWMGEQQEGYGLCNATMGGVANAEFVTRWLAEYKTFRSRGHDEHWDEHSVRLPYALAGRYPESITVFDRRCFFEPTWEDIRTVFLQPGERLARSYSVHLWESFSWPWLSQLTTDTLNRESEIGARLRAAGVL